MEEKYNRLNPLYLIFGDFNLHLEGCNKDSMGDWTYFPEKSKRTAARNIRPEEPIDYVLIKTPFCIDDEGSTKVIEFSPLPLEAAMFDDDQFYWLSNKAGLLNELLFTGNNDLKIKYSNKTCKGRKTRRSLLKH